MKRTLASNILVALLLVAGSRSNAQSQGTLSGVYDFGLKEAAAVANKKAGELTNVFGKGFSLDVDGFLGTTIKTKTPIGGVLVGKRGKLADQVEGYLGVGVSIAQGRTWSPAVGAGFSWWLD